MLILLSHPCLRFLSIGPSVYLSICLCICILPARYRRCARRTSSAPRQGGERRTNRKAAAWRSSLLRRWRWRRSRRSVRVGRRQGPPPVVRPRASAGPARPRLRGAAQGSTVSARAWQTRRLGRGRRWIRGRRASPMRGRLAAVSLIGVGLLSPSLERSCCSRERGMCVRAALLARRGAPHLAATGEDISLLCVLW